MAEVCQHCKKRKVARPRGLCSRCYNEKSIRNQYPVEAMYMKNRGSGIRGDQTMEELDALISERRPTMPRE